MYHKRETILSFVLHHCVKSLQIRSFSGPYFPVFGLNTEIYSVNLRIQSKCGKIRTGKKPVFGQHLRLKTDLRKSADISKLMTHGKNWCQIFLDIFSCSLIPPKFINVAYEIRKNRRGSIPILLMDPKEILTLPVPIPEEERKLTFYYP